LQKYGYTHIPDLGTVWKGVVRFVLSLQGNNQVPRGFETGLNPEVSINNKLPIHTELDKVSCIKLMDESLIFSGSLTFDLNFLFHITQNEHESLIFSSS
jgi:hypothetical protein